ncbi:flagellar motor switch protein FliM [Stomatohabitans albus]|uniref:flagellar motor switch protein FliM n=1 Tax=Stomatohabitans albus TaxID=3110766 RepID=UPI00300CAA37
MAASANSQPDDAVVLTRDVTGMVHERHVSAYNFKRPNKVTRDHVRALQLVHETFARQLSTIFSSTLRTICPISVDSIEQETYDEFISVLPNPTFLGILAVDPLPGRGMLHLPQDCAMNVVDRLLGGQGLPTNASRPMSEIEVNVLRGLLDRGVRELKYAFESFMKVDGRIASYESNPQFAQLLSLSDMVVTGTYTLSIEDESWQIKLSFPYNMLEPALIAFTQSKQANEHKPEELAEVRLRLREHVEQAKVEVRVEFNTVSVAAEEIIDLRIGDVLPLSHRVKDPLTVKIGDQPCFEALPGRSGNRLSCMVITDSSNNPFLRKPAEFIATTVEHTTAEALDPPMPQDFINTIDDEQVFQE